MHESGFGEVEGELELQVRAVYHSFLGGSEFLCTVSFLRKLHLLPVFCGVSSRAD